MRGRESLNSHIPSRLFVAVNYCFTCSFLPHFYFLGGSPSSFPTNQGSQYDHDNILNCVTDNTLIVLRLVGALLFSGGLCGTRACQKTLHSAETGSDGENLQNGSSPSRAFRFKRHQTQASIVKEKPGMYFLPANFYSVGELSLVPHLTSYDPSQSGNIWCQVAWGKTATRAKLGLASGLEVSHVCSTISSSAPPSPAASERRLGGDFWPERVVCPFNTALTF